MKAAAASYRQAFATSSDPLFKVIGKVGGVLGGVGSATAGRVRDWWQTTPRAYDADAPDESRENEPPTETGQES